MRSRFPLLATVLSTLVLLLAVTSIIADHTNNPDAVTVAGDLQEELGCPGDWQPECEATHLTYDDEDDVWQGVFNVPAGDWNYKAPINNSWDENYGAGAVQGGDNIPLSLNADTDVKFYYDHKTHWITDNVSSLIVSAPGSFQDELGCTGDWQPWCLRSWLQDPDGDGVFTFTTEKLPAGDYECKAALNESWDVNYGVGGQQNGANIPFNVAENCDATRFSFDSATNVLSVDSPETGTVQPDAVTVAGSLQEELGCPGDWQPDCTATHLAFDAGDGVWQNVFNVPAGNWEYKAPINNSWDENYGLNAQPNGPNIPLNLDADTDVKFYFSRDTNWITDNVNSVIATLAGSFQEELGCPGDWQPDCLQSWLQDPDGDGIYTFSTSKVPVGSWEVKVAINESWDENYGADGAPGGANIPFTVTQPCTEIFFTYDPVSHLLTVGTEISGPQGNLNAYRAHWVSEELLLWDSTPATAAASLKLHYAGNGGMNLGADGVQGVDMSFDLESVQLPAVVDERYPHLAGYSGYAISAADTGMVPEMLRGQVAVAAYDAEGALLDATSIQIPFVLDDLYTYDGDLGVVWNGGVPTMKLWAPTAKNVTLHVFDDADPATSSMTYPMTWDDGGVWYATGSEDWNNRFYLYEVEVYAPATGQVENNMVTDPYSLSLSADSQRSQIVDMNARALKPRGWDNLQKPRIAAPTNTVVYELHVRDFSWSDDTVPMDYRGTFKAFTMNGSDGMRHLRALSRSGMTHVHLLPSFDIATVPERRETHQNPSLEELASYPPDSTEQQAIITATEDADGFNWGYDPWHYTVPEGSYATDPDGETRVREFREMVQSLNRSGLRVVMDVVYNHTNAAGQNAKSVLDRVVPGYYHRLNPDGVVEQSSCCPNTASEHNMMEKLMIDSLVTWARDYKVDGFRFDLMGHHMKRNMLAVREALDALTLEEDGVDGSSILIYGEGWNFGEVADGARGENAIQRNMAGTGIATFNDRIRDAARGGGPFSGLQEQGFLTGLYVDPNATDQGDMTAQFDRLLLHQDQIRIGLAGNLADYTFVDRNGDTIRGDELDYNGQPAGYTAAPGEVVNYVAAHDNETLFDAIQFKLPLSTSTADRARVQNLGVSLVTLGQGIPFIHAGQDMLRSKSLDRDSFNSGDWFNRLDFTYQDNNWGGGLPVASKNEDNWPIMQPLLADPTLVPSPDDIKSSVQHFREMLWIRRDSPLFRLRTAEEVQERLRFHNTGPDQMPGLIVMELNNEDGDYDDRYRRIVVVWNASTEEQVFPISGRAGFRLHPRLRDSFDPVVRAATFEDGTFRVPARTTAVFVERMRR